MLNIKEAKRIITEYDNLRKNRPYGYGDSSSAMLETCKKLEALSLEWGDQVYYPDFLICNGEFNVLNSATHYEFDPDKYYIHWDNGNIGRLMFINNTYYYSITDDEWDEFLATLRSYNPLDYDMLNCHIVYDIENGKKVMADYKDICDRTRNKMNAKIKAAEIEKKRQEIERLQKELEES